ncbi:MAG: hypothetical protein ABI812_03515 [Betaproteobacteria bacterium]
MVEGARRLIGAVLAAGALAAAHGAGAQALRATGTCRDGLPHGAYQLVADDGTLRVAGAFNRGKRTSSFIFWSARGVRIAQIPYDEGQWSGTLTLWYADPARGRDPQPKHEAGYAAGRLNGEKRSWYANGKRRAQFVYAQGMLVDGKAWSAGGAPLAETASRDLGAHDAEADERYYASLEAIVNAHPPRCDEAAAPPQRASRNRLPPS